MLHKTASITALMLAIFFGVATGLAQETDSQPTNNTGADNTRINRRDRNESERTADQQKDNRSDRELTRHVRRALVKYSSLSTYAHNVKIISEGGKITLKGPVRSEEEKQAIEAKAVEVEGQGNVTNEIHVAPGKHSGNNHD